MAQVVANTQALEGQEIAPVGGHLRSTVSRNSTRSTHRALPVLVAAARSRGTHIPLLVWGAEMFLGGNVCQLETVGTYYREPEVDLKVQWRDSNAASFYLRY